MFTTGGQLIGQWLCLRKCEAQPQLPQATMHSRIELRKQSWTNIRLNSSRPNKGTLTPAQSVLSSLLPFPTTPGPLPIGPLGKLWPIKGTLRRKWRAIRIASCTSTLMTLEVGAIISVVDCDRLPGVHCAQSKDGVCMSAGHRHNLHSASVNSQCGILLD